MLIIMAAALVVVRIALPSIVRSVLVSRANAALAGRLEVGDVDLWLLLGGVALKDVAVHAEDAAATDPPLVAFRQLYVQVGFLPFLKHKVEVEDVELDGLALNVDRLRDNTLVLPRLREAPAAEAPAEAPSGTPWSVVVDTAALRDGHFRLRDHVVEPPEVRELVLDELALSGFSLQVGPGAEPAHGVIEAKFGDGLVRLKTRLARRTAGFGAHARVKIVNLPLDRAHVHVPALGWNELAGRLDAMLVLHSEPATTPTVAGGLALRDLRVGVPGQPEPALAWRRLAVDIERLDPLARQAFIHRVALDDGEMIVTPRGPVPLPIIPVRHDEPPVPAPPEPPAPWTWRVGRIEVSDTKAHVALEPPPLEIVVSRASVTGLDSAPGSRAAFEVEVHEGEGTIHLDGTAALQPVAATVNARIEQLALARLAAASGGSPITLAGGTLSGEVAVEAPSPLVVKGQLALDDLDARPPAGEDFSLGWKRVELGIRELRVASAEPLRVDLEQLRLTAPAVLLTRTAEGLVLPGSGQPAAHEGEPPAAAAPAPSLALGTLHLEGGQVVVVDRSVKPYFRGQVGAIGLDARGLRYPENVFDDFVFAAMLPGNAPLSLKGNQAKGIVKLEGNAKRFPLPQLNPYVTQAAGMSIPRGAASFSSTVQWGAKGYDSRSRIELDRLTLAGAQGESLFAQHFGVPLSLALGLLRDVHGRIALTIPARGDRAGGVHLDLGAIVVEALQHAIVNAIASPLKLLGAVNIVGGKVEGFAPAPVAFVAGKTEPAAEATERIGQVASVVAGAPALRLELHGMAGPDDVRALQEAAVLADLQKEHGVIGAVKNAASGGDRKAVREALATGARDALSEGQRAALEKWVAEKSISDGDLRTLAGARADRLRETLTRDYGLGERVTVGEVEIDREKGRAGVGVSLAGQMSG